MSRPPVPPPLPQTATSVTPSPIRWRLASEEARGALFSVEDLVVRHRGVGAYRSMEFLHVNAKRVINRVPAQSRVPFRCTINAYRGCSHACVYCFARPTHEYLGLDPAGDFERRIVVKVNAVERVEAELCSPAWRAEHIAMGTNTDPYQKAEAKYHLTRGIVEVLGHHRNPFSILTKSTLVLRDLDVLLAAAGRTEVGLAFSIGTLDEEVWRLAEPGTPPPRKRVEAVRTLNQAGIPCSVLVAPVLPGLSDRDEQVRAVARACAEAGAASISPIGLHLRPGVRELYLGWLGRARPDLLGLHRERFGRRSYQPENEQRRLRALVEEAVGEVRGRPGRTASPAHGQGGPPQPGWRRSAPVTGHEGAAAERTDPLAGGDRPARPEGGTQLELF